MTEQKFLRKISNKSVETENFNSALHNVGFFWGWKKLDIIASFAKITTLAHSFEQHANDIKKRHEWVSFWCKKDGTK